MIARLNSADRMPIFLFRFGFETPVPYRNNEAHGWDDEDSHAVFIECADPDAALKWGREIAEAFVQRLWAADGRPGPSWKAGELRTGSRRVQTR
jgi:hypothetical protein